MEVLRGCEVGGHYRWTEVSAKHDELEIRNARDLWAKIPLAAAKLVSVVEQHGALHLDMQLVGQYAGVSVAPARDLLQGRRCEEATHVVGSLMVGAFELSSTTGGSFKAGAEVHGAGAGVGASRHEGYYSSDGNPDSCRSQQSYSSYAPPEDCQSLLQIELLEIPVSVPAAQGRCPSDMVLIEFAAGSNFCLDQHEVTVREYADCAASHTCSEAPATVHWPGIVDEEHDRFDDLCNQDRGTRRKHPVNCLTWDQAASYCRAQNKRLPTSAEWRWAASGGQQNRTFPWGEDAPSAKHVNACGKECTKAFEDLEPLYGRSDGFVGTAPVDSYRDGTGRWGLVDMGGNVREWSADRGYSGVLIFGGSALTNTVEELRSQSASEVSAGTRHFDLGMRCASDPMVVESSKRRGRSAR
ncbi:Serine/threonine-protein kinase pkn1 [Enhygromyxa salina]|uniref:Serine/threonine-protein kinase pkn1 n=1 Tax=Enhygromyxa salina TaxID=215803 RepID=A0A2S9XV67_9BACT|nr:SUMF1/EgtB/PvdO family nonheme iron enzyme [Enhygromyxa salina]PRP96768.1 Serine/threonine-protein kinase pkn1 [Enhygromyxa salina]